jgi:excisionase family DNA binding protein
MPSVPDLIGTAEAAQVLGIDRSTLSRWTKDGRITPALQLPAHKGAYLYHRADVEALLEPDEPEEAAS